MRKLVPRLRSRHGRRWPASRLAAAPEKIEAPFPTGKKLSVILRGKSHDLVRFEPALKKLDNVLGKLATEWIEKPGDWIGQIEKDDKEAFEEFLSFVEPVTSANLTFPND